MLTKTTVRCYYTFFKRAKLKKNNRKHQVLLRIQCHGDLSYTVKGRCNGTIILENIDQSLKMWTYPIVWLRQLTPTNLVRETKGYIYVKKILYKNVCNNFTYVLVTQLCPTLCTDCSLRGSSVREIFQARILEWVAIPSSKNVYSNFLL